MIQLNCACGEDFPHLGDVCHNPPTSHQPVKVMSFRNSDAALLTIRYQTVQSLLHSWKDIVMVWGEGEHSHWTGARRHAASKPSPFSLIECFSIECRMTKTKVITTANQNKGKNHK